MMSEKILALNELEASRFMEKYGINMVQSAVITDCDEKSISEVVDKLGFPMVMKILSDDILHKTDVGCVALGIRSMEEMKDAFEKIMNNAKTNVPGAKIQGILVEQMMPSGLEVLMGVSTDPQFGHVIMVGMGGIMVELLKAVTLRVLPITRGDAEDMIDETPLRKAFEGLRGVKYDREELVKALLNLSKMVEENPDIKEIDVNPFLLYGEGKKATGVDALIVRMIA